jgi:transcription initiation factor IIE alpha subunit
MAKIGEQKRRLRGEVLKLIYGNHETQQARIDEMTLTSVLERLRFDVSVNLVREVLHDLRERGFVSFDEQRDRVTGRSPIRQVQITPGGSDIVEETGSDPGVEVN